MTLLEFTHTEHETGYEGASMLTKITNESFTCENNLIQTQLPNLS